MAETFDAIGYFHEGSKLCGAQNLAVDNVTQSVAGEERLPNVRLHLLDAEREAAMFGLNGQYLRLHLFALLQHFRRMLHALGPAQVTYVNETVDAVFDFDKCAEVGKIADFAFDYAADRVLIVEHLP